jgi:phosphatidylglycerol:prolipoprotein diacylglycerol transferase
MHPYLLRTPVFQLPSYGVLVATGIVAGLLLALWLGRRVRLPKDFILDIVFWCVVAGLVGGRITYLLLEWRAFLANPLGTLFAGAGQVFLGGLLAALVAIVFVCRHYRVAIALASDVLAPALALGHAFGRVGCFLAGCCYGAPTQSALGVSFPRFLDKQGNIIGSLPYLDHLDRGLVTTQDACSLSIYPVQLFESIGNLLICLGLVLLWRRRRFDGQIALCYVLAYGALRFGLEFLRGDSVRGIFYGLSTSQWLTLLLAAGAIALWPRLRRKGATVYSPCDEPTERASKKGTNR